MMNTDDNLSNRPDSGSECGACHMQEVARLLTLAAIQIEISLDETKRCGKTLADSFGVLGGRTHELLSRLGQQTTPATPRQQTDGMQDISRLCLQLHDHLNSAVMASQNHDRLTQRLTQLIQHLNRLSVLLARPCEIASKWQKLTQSIRASYTMAGDRALYDAIMSGATAEQAIAHYRTALEGSKSGEVGLF